MITKRKYGQILYDLRMGVASLSRIPMTEITIVTEVTASKIKAIKQIKKKKNRNCDKSIVEVSTIITVHQQN